MSTQAPSGFGPGSRLAQAREDRALSIEEVARALRLSARHIQALEADDYENLPGPTYVRGYLRSYAQLLDLPVEEIIASYNALSVAQQPVDLGKLAPPEQLSSDHGVVRLVSALVLGLFLMLAVVWWYGRKEPAALVPPAPATATAAGGEGHLPAADGGGLAAPPAALGTTGAQAPRGAFGPPPAAAEGRPPTEHPPAPEAAAARMSPPPSVPAARAQLVLQTVEESWVEVRDASGNRLLYETVPAGRTVSIDGEAPLSVLLGNVDGVRVTFNGRPYDAGRHRRGPVARFTLGTESGRP